MTARFSFDRPCPVCGGYDRMPRARGERCFGYLSDDGAVAFCTREEKAGSLPKGAGSQAYAHLLGRTCQCGVDHDMGQNRPALAAPKRRIVKVYQYNDKNGAPLFEVVRYEPKGFAQRRPDGSGGYVYNLDGTRRVLYCLPDVLAAASQGGRVYVTEGEKDADALVAVGLCATTAPMGAGKWRDEYAAVLTGAEVVVIADKDAAGRAHARAVADSSSRTARSVRLLELPGDNVKDLADWISSGGSREGLEALANATPPRSSAAPTPGAARKVEKDNEEGGGAFGPSMPSPRQPMRVAGRIVDEQYRDPLGVLTLRWWRGSFYGWSAGRWTELADATVRAGLYRLLRDAHYVDERGEIKPWAPAKYRISDLFDALKAVCHTSPDTEPPSWLDRNEADPSATDLVALSNGLLHVPTRSLHPHTPRFFNTVGVPFPYEAVAPAPRRWLTFLSQLWPDDADAVSTLAEWFGYVLAGDTRMHKILLIVGPFRSGKGTIARVQEALVGRANTCGPTLASLSTNFGLQDLIGKTLAIVADARLGTQNANVVVERLLSVSGEDALSVDRKYKEHWFGRLGCRFMILSNELPGFGDASGAIATRFVVLTLARSWLGKEDHDLTSALLGELSGILNWSLDGLDRLRARGRFTEAESARDAILALHDTVSPTSAFVRDRCVVGAEHEVGVDVLYQAWRAWCEEQGRDRPGSAATFGKHLRAVVPGVKRIRPREVGGREYRYAGVRLGTPGDPQWAGPGTDRDQPPPEQPAAAPALDGPRANAMWSASTFGDDPMLRAAIDSGLVRAEDVAVSVEVPF